MRRPSFTVRVARGLSLVAEDSALLNNSDRNGTDRECIRRAREYIERMHRWHATRPRGKEAKP